MTKNLNKILAICMIFIACKNSDSPTQETEVEATPKSFTITINAIVEESDDFQFFFNETDSPEFKDTDSKITSIVGNKNSQDIVFELPKYAKPVNFRFDIGSNSNQKPITINIIKFEYLTNNFVIEGKDFSKYFYSVNQVELKDQDPIVITSYKEGEVYDPILLGNELLKEKLAQLYIVQ